MKAHFPEFMHEEIALKDISGRHGTATNYRSSLASLRRFADDTATDISTLYPAVICLYQSWLIASGVVNNTISFYMRALRAVYMKMVKRGLVSDSRPFDSVYTGIAKTRKRAVSEADMRRIKELDLSDNPRMEYVRDLFLLSFYLIGISFVDLAFLRKTDLRDGIIRYLRAKTGQELCIGVNHRISAILDKYATPPDSPYLLPIIVRPGEDERKQYQSALRLFNKTLKRIAHRAGITTNITTYTSRHSWASIAKMRRVDISTISEAMGHQSEATTRIYLASLDNSYIDQANDLTTTL